MLKGRKSKGNKIARVTWWSLLAHFPRAAIRRPGECLSTLAPIGSDEVLGGTMEAPRIPTTMTKISPLLILDPDVIS